MPLSIDPAGSWTAMPPVDHADGSTERVATDPSLAPSRRSGRQRSASGSARRTRSPSPATTPALSLLESLPRELRDEIRSYDGVASALSGVNRMLHDDATDVAVLDRITLRVDALNEGRGTGPLSMPPEPRQIVELVGAPGRFGSGALAIRTDRLRMLAVDRIADLFDGTTREAIRRLVRGEAGADGHDFATRLYIVLATHYRFHRNREDLFGRPPRERGRGASGLIGLSGRGMAEVVHVLREASRDLLAGDLMGETPVYKEAVETVPRPRDPDGD